MRFQKQTTVWYLVVPRRMWKNNNNRVLVSATIPYTAYQSVYGTIVHTIMVVYCHFQDINPQNNQAVYDLTGHVGVVLHEKNDDAAADDDSQRVTIALGGEFTPMLVNRLPKKHG